MRDILNIVGAALSVALMLGAMAGLNTVNAQSPVDYDADDDGLIEIEWLEQLNAIRWDLDGNGIVDEESNTEAYSTMFPDAIAGMGCAEDCRGYELTRDLDFKSAGSYASGAMNDKWTSGNGWLPIGVSKYKVFDATFEGNGRTIANLYINQRSDDDLTLRRTYGILGDIGLFSDNLGDIRQTRLIGVEIFVDLQCASVGGLVANNFGSISHSSSTGKIHGKCERAGGLVGQNTTLLSLPTGEVSGGTIAFSYSTGSVTGPVFADFTGGLVGYNLGSIISSYSTSDVSSGEGPSLGRKRSAGGLVGKNEGSVVSSYATGRVSGDDAGGLVGWNNGNIASSYSLGVVSGYNAVGGFVGINDGEGEIFVSYWNTETSKQSTGIGRGSDAGIEDKTTAELQEPIDYSGIYADWLTDYDNADEDTDKTTGVDDVWDFGTYSQYPQLKADPDDSRYASRWEFGAQHSTPVPAPISTPIVNETRAPTAMIAQTATPTITPTPYSTSTPTSNSTISPVRTVTLIPMATATHMPTQTVTHSIAPSDTPEPPTQTPVIIVVTATPSADTPASGGCNSVGVAPAGTAATNMLFVIAPLAIIGVVRSKKSFGIRRKNWTNI